MNHGQRLSGMYAVHVLYSRGLLRFVDRCRLNNVMVFRITVNTYLEFISVKYQRFYSDICASVAIVSVILIPAYYVVPLCHFNSLMSQTKDNELAHHS